MTREERSGWRDEWMSKWHRDNLPNSCPCHDLDSIEWRYGRPVALIEWKYGTKDDTEEHIRTVFDKSRWTLGRYPILAKKLEVEAFLIQYDRKGWFRLWHFEPGPRLILKPLEDLDEYQMIQWHINLGNNDPLKIPEKEPEIVKETTSLSEVF